MSRTHVQAKSRMQQFASNPAVLAIALTLALAGCANKKNLPNNASELGLNGSSATPGSTQDFTVNVGDRIFFDTDSSSIRADAQQTLDRQAQWLQRYPNYAITIEGHADERGTREYNLALGARRAATTRDYLISRVCSGPAAQDHFLRQGTPCCRMRRHLLLVAEPSRRHRPRRRRSLIDNASRSFERRSALGRLFAFLSILWPNFHCFLSVIGKLSLSPFRAQPQCKISGKRT